MIHFLVHGGEILFDTIETSADRHRFNVADTVDAGQIAAGFAERLVESSLEFLR